MKNEDTPLIIVLARNYSTGLSVVRSLGAAGYTVDLIASSYKKGRCEIIASSKYVRNAVEVVSKKIKFDEGNNALFDMIMTYVGKEERKPVLFPTDDYTASVIDQSRNLLEEYFIMPSIAGGGQGSLIKYMDKIVQAEIARTAGILIPKEWVISLENEIKLPVDMVYPCFCKPMESISGYKTEMKACDNEEELQNHLEYLRKRNPERSILVQEFLVIDNEIDFSGVCKDQEVIIPGIIRKTRVAQYEKGVTLSGKIVPFEELGELQEKIISMLQKFHYIGMFDMEFTVVGDKLYFNEVNLRSGGPNFSYFMSGINLPNLAVKAMLGKNFTAEETRLAEYGKSFVYEKVAWEDYMYGFMTKQELNNCIASADITLLYNDDDPMPGKIFLRHIKKSVLKNRIKKVLRFAKRTVKAVKSAIKKPIKKYLFPPLRKVKYILLGYPQVKKENQRKADAEKPRVLVAGRNYSSNLCMAKSLGEAGYEVEVLRIFQTKPKAKDLMKILKPDAYSKYVKAYHRCVSHRKSRNIVTKLKQISDENYKMLLIPADDLVANIADEYLDELKHYYLLPNIGCKADAINQLMSKDIQKQLAKAAGLTVVNSCVIKTSRGRFDIPDTVHYPCFIKPNISKNSSKSRMRVCETEDELRATLTEFSAKKDIEMLVEDYIEISKEYALLGLSTKECVVAPGFFVTEQGGNKERRGVALVGRMLSCAEYQPLIDDLVRFVEALKFEGLFDVDLIEDVNGTMYFTELNLRYGASGYALTKCGVNLPAMFADYMFYGKQVPADCSIEETGKTFISEKIMLDEYIGGFLSKEEADKTMELVDLHFIKDENDMRPYRHFKKFYPVASLKRHYLKAKNSQSATP